MKVSASACIITRDDESHIPGCLESLRWADEAVVGVDDCRREASEAVARGQDA